MRPYFSISPLRIRWHREWCVFAVWRVTCGARRARRWRRRARRAQLKVGVGDEGDLEVATRRADLQLEPLLRLPLLDRVLPEAVLDADDFGHAVHRPALMHANTDAHEAALDGLRGGLRGDGVSSSCLVVGGHGRSRRGWTRRARAAWRGVTVEVRRRRQRLRALAHSLARALRVFFCPGARMRHGALTDSKKGSLSHFSSLVRVRRMRSRWELGAAPSVGAAGSSLLRGHARGSHGGVRDGCGGANVEGVCSEARKT